MNTRKQGDIGLGAAIGYFTRIGWSISIPLTESQRYDLVVDDGVKLMRVEVKTTTYKRNNVYVAQIKTSGGNQTGTGKKTPFDSASVDLLFVLDGDGNEYCLPSLEVECTGQLCLGKRVQKWKV